MTSDDPEPRMVKMGAGGEDKLLKGNRFKNSTEPHVLYTVQ